MTVKEGSIIAGLDVGTTKICAIVGEVSDEQRIDIIGIGSAPSRGLRKGVVVNIEGTVKSIEKAVKEAELMAGVDLNTVFVGIAGSHIKGINSRGVVAVSGKNKEISKHDITRAIDAARAVAIPVDREVLHILPQEYIIDEQDGIIEPLGMSGVRLEVEVHIITAAVTSAQNLVKSVNRAGLEIEDIVLEQFASSKAALTPQEKEIGAVLIDIGGGTTDVIVFVNGKVRHTSVLGWEVIMSLMILLSDCELLPAKQNGLNAAMGVPTLIWSRKMKPSKFQVLEGESPEFFHGKFSVKLLSPGWKKFLRLSKVILNKSGMMKPF